MPHFCFVSTNVGFSRSEFLLHLKYFVYCFIVCFVIIYYEHTESVCVDYLFIQLCIVVAMVIVCVYFLGIF